MPRPPLARAIVAALAALAIELAGPPAASAQCPPQLVAHPAAQPEDLLGESCAIDGELLLLGAPQVLTGSGKVAVFRDEGGTWVLKDELLPTPTSPGNAFGFDCDLDGDTAIVASNNASSPCFDCLSFFERRFDALGVPFWERTASFPVGVPRVDGRNVAISGDVAVVGRGYTSDDVLVYRRSNGVWGMSQAITPPSGHGSASFGDEVALEGQLLVASGGGRTYVYRLGFSSFVLEDELVDGSGAPVGGKTGVLDRSPIEYAAVATTAGVHVFSAVPQPFPLPPVWAESDFVAHPSGPLSQQNFLSFDFDAGPPPLQPLRYALGDLRASGDEGLVWILERSGGWSVRQKLVEPGSHFFGFDVDLDGARLATSTWTVDLTGQTSAENHGAGWVYELSPGACPTGCRAPRLPDAFAASGDELGAAVEIHGDLAFVGAPGDDTRGTDAGAVHVYRRFGGCWSREQTLFASDAASGDRFGEDLDLEPSGLRLIVGAPRSDGAAVDSGSAYVFDDVGGGCFVESAALRAGQELASGSFGGSVAIDFSFAVVGAPGSPGATSDRAFVFQRLGSSWVQVQELLPDSSGLSYAGFGRSVDITDSSLVVGSDADGDAGSGAGAVYHYVGNPFSGFVRTEKVLAPAGASADGFGGALALQHSTSGGDLLVVGAPGARDGAFDDAGQVYVFDGVGFAGTLLFTLGAPDPAPRSRFGSSLDLDGMRLVVGAAADKGAGSAYAYCLAPPLAVQLEGAIHGSPRNATSGLGADVAVDDTAFLIGAPHDQGSILLDTGAAWFRGLEDFQTSAFVRRLSF